MRTSLPVSHCPAAFALLAAFFFVCSEGSGQSVHASSPPAPMNAEQIASLTLAGGTITTAEAVAAGSFTPPGAHDPMHVPAFFRIAATLKPSPDSNIRIEVWLPTEGWNEQLLGTGTGGGGGGISYWALLSGVKRGFATVNTDLGTSPGADQMVDHPDRWEDFGHRSTHEMTVAAKTLIKAHYGKEARRAYFVGASTGGQQALSEAQRYPEDYDGIMAGAPANNRTHLHTSFVWILQALTKEPARALSSKKIHLLTQEVLKQNVGKDGGAPGDQFLTDPRMCHLDFEKLPKCPAGQDTDEGFTDAQLAALREIYTGPVNPRTGERIYAPLPLGTEASASGLGYQGNALAVVGSLFYQQKWVFGAGFDYRTFDFAEDLAKQDARLAPILNANQADLSAFKKRGGKLLMYSGTADPLVPFPDTLNYYERVVAAQGGMEATQSFFRYFLVPGMMHGGGGSPGVNSFGQDPSSAVKPDSEHDAMRALMKWVEEGVAPDKIIATAWNEGGKPDNGLRFERPIFPYPKFPKYVGGDEKLPESFVGEDRPRGHVEVPAERYLR